MEDQHNIQRLAVAKSPNRRPSPDRRENGQGGGERDKSQRAFSPFQFRDERGRVAKVQHRVANRQSLTFSGRSHSGGSSSAT